MVVQQDEIKKSAEIMENMRKVHSEMKVMKKKLREHMSGLNSNQTILKIKEFKHRIFEIKGFIQKDCKNNQKILPIQKKLTSGIQTVLKQKNLELYLEYKKLKNSCGNIFSQQKDQHNIQQTYDNILDKNRINFRKQRKYIENPFQQQNNEQQELEQNQGDIRNQNEQLKSINQTLNKFVSTFQKMTEMVSFHDEMISDIENNTIESYEHMSKGKEFIVQIYQDVNSNRKLIIQFFLALLLISLVYLLLI